MSHPMRGRRQTQFAPVLAAATAAAVVALCPSAPARATDIIGVMPAGLDQPRVNAIVRYPLGNVGVSDPLSAEDPFFGGRFFNIQAFYDTGASGVLISSATADMLGLPNQEPGLQRQMHNGQLVKFEDVGVAGSSEFNVSVPLHIQIGPYTPNTAEQVTAAEDEYSTYGTLTNVNNIYRQYFGPIRTQIGPIGGEPNPLLEGLDVFGMPTMKGKVIVMDPKPVDPFIDTMRTYTYDPGTPFNPSQADDDPGIPRTTRSIKLSYGSFGEFTKVTPTGAPGPTIDHNPFIGPNPVNPAGDPTPPVKISYNGLTTAGSFLLDTGAAASIISKDMANGLNIRYVRGSEGTDNPQLEVYNPTNPDVDGTVIDDQFSLTIGGIGGTTKISGFFLSSMLLKTTQGNAANDDDPRHLRFIDAPVLVSDIAVENPDTGRQLTLDGIFGMNYLVASAFVSEGGPGGLPVVGALTPGAFDWVVFDEPGGLLNLRPRIPGDANRDGTVNFEDLVTIAQNYDSTAQSNTPWNEGDFNGDGEINFADLVSLAQHYNLSDLLDGDVLDLPHYDLGFGAPAPGFASTVPEPAGLFLLGASVIALRARTRRG